MKLLRCIHDVHLSTGGPVAGIISLTPLLARKGVETTIATLCPIDEMHPLKGQVHIIEGSAKSTYGFDPGFSAKIKDAVLAADLILIHGCWQYHGLAVSALCRRLKKAYYVIPHGMLDPWFKHYYPLKHLKKMLYWWLFEHRVLSHAEAVLFTSEEEKRLAPKSFFPNNYHSQVIPYGVDGMPEAQGPIINYKLQISNSENREARIPNSECCPKDGGAGKEQGARSKEQGGISNYKLQISNDRQSRSDQELSTTNLIESADRRILLFMSRLHEKKGLDVLFQAFEEFEWTNEHLLIAGPAKSEAYLQELKTLASRYIPEDRITWAGMLEGEDKWDAFRVADAFILPSHQENFGMVVAESLSAGVPVFISNKVNIWKEIAAAGAGYVEADTLDGTRRLLMQWKELSSEMRADMSANARACYSEHFSSESAAEAIYKLISSE